jgi:WD40 repeat protein
LQSSQLRAAQHFPRKFRSKISLRKRYDCATDVISIQKLGDAHLSSHQSQRLGFHRAPHIPLTWCQFQVTHRDASWSPDGNRIATGSAGGSIDIWDFPSGKLHRSMLFEQKSFVGDVEWSPDGRKLVTGPMGPVTRVWDVESGKELLTLPALGWSVSWSPDGQYILATSGYDDQGAKDTTVRIWEADTGKNILVIDGHSQQVTTGDWSPDMSRIVTSTRLR